MIILFFIICLFISSCEPQKNLRNGEEYIGGRLSERCSNIVFRQGFDQDTVSASINGLLLIDAEILKTISGEDTYWGIDVCMKNQRYIVISPKGRDTIKSTINFPDSSSVCVMVNSEKSCYNFTTQDYRFMIFGLDYSKRLYFLNSLTPVSYE